MLLPKTLPKTLFGSLFGPWRVSGLVRFWALMVVFIPFIEIEYRNAFLFVGVLCVLLSINDLAWAVVLEEERMMMGGLRKRPVARRNEIQSAFVAVSTIPSSDDKTVALRLASGSEYQIEGSGVTADHELWVEEINRWVAHQ